jgi:hypothetical protein
LKHPLGVAGKWNKRDLVLLAFQALLSGGDAFPASG